jgi:hypothetical protein
VVIRRDRCCILQRGAHDLGRIDNAFIDQIDIFLAPGVEAEGYRFLVKQLADDDRCFHTGVLDDLAQRRLDRLLDDRDARILVLVVA